MNVVYSCQISASQVLSIQRKLFFAIAFIERKAL
jgi:hypothetical protein